MVLLAIDCGPTGRDLYSGRVAMAESYGVDPLNLQASEPRPKAAEQATEPAAVVEEQLQLAGLPPAADDAEPTAAQAPKGGKKPTARYRNATTGETWSGRGLQPKWLKAAIARGGKLTDYALRGTSV